MPTPAYNVPSPTMLDVFPTTPPQGFDKLPLIQYPAVADFKVWQYECPTAKMACKVRQALVYQAKKAQHAYRIVRTGCVVTFQRMP